MDATTVYVTSGAPASASPTVDCIDDRLRR